MKAKCPHCRGTGEIDATIARGDLYTKRCGVCGHENGGRVANDDIPLTPPDTGCIKCGASKQSCYYRLVAKDIESMI